MEQRRAPGPPATAGPRGRHRRSPGPAPPQPQPRVPLTPPPWPEPPPPHGPAAILESHDARPPTPPAGSDAEASSSSSAGIVYFYRRRPLSLRPQDGSSGDGKGGKARRSGGGRGHLGAPRGISGVVVPCRRRGCALRQDVTVRGSDSGAREIREVRGDRGYEDERKGKGLPWGRDSPRWDELRVRDSPRGHLGWRGAWSALGKGQPEVG